MMTDADVKAASQELAGVGQFSADEIEAVMQEQGEGVGGVGKAPLMEIFNKYTHSN